MASAIVNPTKAGYKRERSLIARAVAFLKMDPRTVP